MAESFHLSIVTAEETIYEGEADYVRLPTGFGSVGILAHHAPMLCAVSKGVMLLRVGEDVRRITLSEGLASVGDNEVTVLVSQAEDLAE